MTQPILDLKNTLAVDAEWLVGYKLVCFTLTGYRKGVPTAITVSFPPNRKGKPRIFDNGANRLIREPTVDVDGTTLIYFATGADIALVEPFIRGTYSHIELSQLFKLKYNALKKYVGGEKVAKYMVKGSLAEYARAYLKIQMTHKRGDGMKEEDMREIWRRSDISKILDGELDWLTKRNREDSLVTFRLAEYIDNAEPHSAAARLFYTRAQAERMSRETVAWYHKVLKNGVPLNAKALDLFHGDNKREILENVAKPTNGVYFTAFDEKKKEWDLHMRAKPLAAALREIKNADGSPAITLIESSASYAVEGYAPKFGYLGMKEIYEKGSKEAHDTIEPYYNAEMMRYFLNAKRMDYFRGDRTFPLEVVYGQQSGRCGMTGDAVINLGGIFRAMVKAPLGKVIVSLDLKAEEVFLAAWIYGDKALQEMLTNGKDVYTQIADRLFPGAILKYPRSEKNGYDMSKDEPLRKIVKRAVLAFLYGIGGDSLSGYVGKDMDTAKEILAGLKEEFWEMQKHIGMAQAEAEAAGYAALPLSNFPLYVYDGGNEKQLTNFKIQGMGADLLRYAILQLPDKFKVVGTLFDGVYLEVDEENIDATVEELKATLAGLFSELTEPLFPGHNIPWVVEAQENQLSKYKGGKRPEYFREGCFEKGEYEGQCRTILGSKAVVMTG